MKLISFSQPNFQQGPKEFNAYYLPYSAGVLWSYVKSFPHINENYKLLNYIWKRDALDKSLDLIKDSDVACFSTYVWNKSYNYTLAKRMKDLKPECLIVFGGPEPPITDPEFFKTFPYIDIMVKSEGEKTFLKILESTSLEELRQVPGLLLNIDGETVDTGNPDRINNLEEVPSPYLTGLFDDLMAAHPEVEWNMTLETNRGCPYQCTFCDWGSLTYNKVKKFELDRVNDEIEWAGKNKCGFISITDANFGIFPDRDNLIADKIIEVQTNYGYPNTFSTAWAKNQKQEVVDIVKKLIHSPRGFNQGLTLSVQSLDLDVLENIKRKNLEISKIEEVFDICDKENIPIYTEIILGLPGETLATWKQNFWKLFNSGNHTGVTVFQAQMLENAEMNLLQKKLYKITDQMVYDYMSGSYNEDELKEGIKVITSTKDMSFDEMLEAQIFSWYINTFHINGLTTYISRFLKKFRNIEYSDFYEKLFEYVKQDSWIAEEIEEVGSYYRRWMTTGQIDHPIIGNIEIHGWNLIHRSVIRIHADNKYDHIFNMVEDFINKEYDLDEGNWDSCPDDILEQLMKFQRNYLINYHDIPNYPKVLTFDYDFLGYLQDDANIRDQVQYTFDFNEDKTMSFPRFLDNIYFYRRRNFGKAWITKI